MVNARLAFFFEYSRHFDFVNCDTETYNKNQYFETFLALQKNRDCEMHITETARTVKFDENFSRPMEHSRPSIPRRRVRKIFL